MGLAIFQKQEKVEERTLETITTEESIIDELLTHFKKSLKEPNLDWDKSLHQYVQYLQNFRITPKIIEKLTLRKGFYSKYYGERYPTPRKYSRKGIFLSALIQTGYNQGENNFKFKKIKAACFGACLKGENNNPILIKVGEVQSDFLLSYSKNCYLEYEQLKGSFICWDSENSHHVKKVFESITKPN